MSSTSGIERSSFTSYSGSIDPDHYSEQKNAKYILIDLVHFTRSAKVDSLQIDRSVRIDRSIPCPGKNPKSIFLVLGRKSNSHPKIINPNSLNSLIWTIIWPNSYDFVSFLRIYHSLVRSAKGIVHSFMESHIDGVVLLATDFVQKDEKKDERVDRILDMINSKHDWNNHVWGVKEATNSEFEESGEEKGEDQTVDTERGENSHVAGNVDGTADVSGRNKRKHADRGAESRKKNVLCHLAASSKGNIDTDMKNFLEDLVQASFTAFGEKFCQQFSDRLGKIETEVTQLRTASERTEQFETVVTDRLGKIEAEVTQLRTSLVVTELVGKSDQASGPSLTKINSGPSTSKKGTAPSKKKAVKNQELKIADSCVNLTRAKVTQSSASDLRMVRLDDRDIEIDGENFPDRCLVFVHPTDFKKMQDWQDTRTAIQIGPSMLDGDLAGRIMSASSWLKNYVSIRPEIDAIMYVFRERTTLKRWNVDRVAFMTCVFSDLIAKDYQNFCKGIKKYTMDPLLLQYGKGELPSHGRTRMLWNVDVDWMYVPVWVNCNHWIALCISFVTRNIQVFYCGGKKKIKEVEAFAQLIPRIVKAVQSLTIQKHLHITPYNVSYVPMSGLNRLQCHCGVYTIKHIECHVLGLDISMVSDENIWGARIKIMWDLWEAANDLELIERMSKYEPIKCNKPAETNKKRAASFDRPVPVRSFGKARSLSDRSICLSDRSIPHPDKSILWFLSVKSENGIKTPFINPISLDLTPIWTILEPNPHDFSEITDAVMLVVELHRC
ncbi:hypothetical protein IGI04_006042 [Brassica rapa subsp. trilocularis]|uniref:Ubiquitin-like protease family profile domain-containing protein n=1 Tax=Brassica rapa subsp. trilocularis TaxID=1813537 RepID=A0ABQ7NG77_BRACM|nr:hypothetical protein IGI04_006042 [Brassica rapa subsp. trilocularis]